MKKLATLALFIICALSLASPAFAAEMPDAYELYRKAEKKADASITMETKTVATSEVLMGGVSLGKEKVVGVTKQKKSGGKWELSSITKTESGEETAAYYKDGYLYQSGIKMKLDLEEAVDKFSTIYDFSDFIVAESVRAGTIEALDDGNYKIRFKLSGEDMTSLMDAAMDGLLSSGDIGLKIAMSSVDYTMTITPDGDMVSYGMAFSMSLSDEDVSMTVKYKTSAQIISVNAPVSIYFPPYLETYTLIS